LPHLDIEASDDLRAVDRVPADVPGSSVLSTVEGLDQLDGADVAS